jgi:hypothetical protein
MHLEVSLHISNWRYLVGIKHLQPCKTKRTYSAHNFVVGPLPVPALLYPLCYSIMTPGPSTSYLRSRTQVCDKPAITQEISNTLSQNQPQVGNNFAKKITDTWDRKITNTRTWTLAEYTEVHSSVFQGRALQKDILKWEGEEKQLAIGEPRPHPLFKQLICILVWQSAASMFYDRCTLQTDKKCLTALREKSKKQRKYLQETHYPSWWVMCGKILYYKMQVAEIVLHIYS